MLHLPRVSGFFFFILLHGTSHSVFADDSLVSSNAELNSASTSLGTGTEQVVRSTQSVTLFINGRIYTVDNKRRWAQAMVIQGSDIVYIGNNEGALAFANDSSLTKDLGGKMVMPGIHDVHIHPIESASENTLFELSVDELNPEKFADSILQAAADYPDAPWLIGYGHSIFALLDAKRPPIDILDGLVPNRPVIIMEQTSHSMWVNSAALALANIDMDTPDPTGGVILRDPDSGLPNGILIDNAGNMMMDLALQPTARSRANDYEGLVNGVLPDLAKHGITSISDARSFWQRDDHLTWLKAEQNHALTVRVNVGLWAYPELSDKVQLKALRQLYYNDPNSLLKFNQIKLYSDGIVVNGTAAMHQAYKVDLIGLTGNRGLEYFNQARLSYYIKELEAIGFDFHIHAIGDRGIHQALNAIEQGSSSQGRHRITHVEIIDPADYKRFAELNVTADAQVAGAFSNPEHWSENNELIGAARADHAIPIKSLLDTGARVTLSSDWNVSTFNPFVGLQNAVTRAPQAIRLDQAIAAYTINGAYTMRQEDKVGSLEVGKKADFIVLNQNLFEIKPSNIHQTQVLMTYFNGQLIYQQ